MWGMTKCHLDLPAAAAGFAINQTDAIRSILRQPVFGVADDKQVRKNEQAYASEPAAVEVRLERAIGVVGLTFEHPVHVHHRLASSPAVLTEFRVGHGAVIIHDVRGASILAENNVGGIADRRAIESVRMNLGSAHNRVGCVVVLRSKCRIKVDRIDSWISAAGSEDKRALRQRNTGGDQS